MVCLLIGGNLKVMREWLNAWLTRNSLLAGLARAVITGGTACAVVLMANAAVADKAVKPEVGFDLDRIPRTPLEIGPWVNVGSELRFDSDYLVDFDLDRSMNDNVALFAPRAEFYLSIEPDDSAQVFMRLQYLEAFALTFDPDEWKRNTRVELEELFLLLPEVWDNTSIQVGRQRTRDPREWLFDQEFDSLRVYWRNNPFAVQAFAGGINLIPRRLNEADRMDDTMNYFLGGYFAPAEDSQMGVYGFLRDDLGDGGESQYFIGLQGSGRTDFNLGYWFEGAYVGGHDGGREIDGYGGDVGLYYVVPAPLKVTLAGGFAYGTGDGDLSDGVDGNFRQTGLQDNSGRFRGLTNFNIYGELFDPELSNMAIYTAGLGFRPTSKSSIDLVYHWYHQAVAVPGLRDVRIGADPNGIDTDLGSELDVIIGIREIKNLRIELVGAVFFPGGAFPGADNAYLAELEIKYLF